VSPVPVQMWPGEPCPSADVGIGEPILDEAVGGVRPVPTMRRGTVAPALAAPMRADVPLSTGSGCNPGEDAGGASPVPEQVWLW
jgi:hypothetical protein